MTGPRRSTKHVRALLGEPLESRQLLAGLVEVQLDGGDLLVRGDELANVFAIEQAAGPAASRASLIVVPDVDTSVNGQPPGAPLDLGPVELASVRILPGDGADEVAVNNLSAVGGLKIENSGGSDRYDILGGSFGRVRIDSTPSRSRATLSDLTIGQATDKATPKLQQPICSGRHVDVKMLGVRCHGGAKFEHYATLDLDQVQIDGRLTVTAREGLGELSISDSHLGAANKATPVLMLHARDTNVNMADSDIHGSARLRFSQDGAVQLSSVGIDGRLSVSSREGRGAATLEDVSIARAADKASPQLLQACAFRNFDLDATNLVVGGLVKVSEVRLAPGDSPVNTESVSLNFVKISYKYDAAQSKKASLEIRDSKFDAGLRVTSLRPLDFSTENTSAAGDYYLKLGDVKGESRSSVSLSSLTVGGSLRVESRGPLDLTAENTTAAVDMFLKLSGVKGESKSSVDLSSLSVGGSLRVESHGPLDLTAENTTAAVDMFMKIRGVKGESKSSVDLSSLSVGGSLRVESHGPLDLTAENTTAAVDMFMKIRGVKGESQAATLDLCGVRIGEDLTVLAGAGQEVVQLQETQVGGRTEVLLGGGDDLLSVRDSVFAGFALLHGGRGVDELALEPNAVFLSGYRAVGWELPSPSAEREVGRGRFR